MDDLESTIRLYEQIVPRSTKTIFSASVMRELRIWLQDDVVPLAAAFARRPAFRDHATWPVRAFNSPATHERQSLKQLDEALVSTGRALGRLFKNQRVARELTVAFPPTLRRTRGAVEIGGDRPVPLEVDFEEIDSLAFEKAQIESIPRRPWGDLVNVGDYFSPQQEFLETADGRQIQWANLIVSLNPELHVVGNFIVRGMFQRIDIWRNILASCWKKIDLVSRSRPTNRELTKAAEQFDNLQQCYSRLREITQADPEERLRESCIVVTQILAAFGQHADVGWLGLDPSSCEAGLSSLRGRVTSLRNGQAFERIVGALVQLKQLYVEEPRGQSELESFVASGGLVLDLDECKVYWNCRPIAVEWKANSKSWQLLVALAKKGQLRSYVAEGDLYGDEVVAGNALAAVVNRLKVELPADLRNEIEPGPKIRSYRLKLEPHRIFVSETRRAKTNATRRSREPRP